MKQRNIVENTKTPGIYDVFANRVQTNSNVQTNNLVIKDALEKKISCSNPVGLFLLIILFQANFWRLQKHKKKQLTNFRFGPYQLNIPISNSIR